MEIESAQTFNR